MRRLDVCRSASLCLLHTDTIRGFDFQGRALLRALRMGEPERISILLSTAATLLPYVAGTAAWLRRGDGSARVGATLGLAYSLYALWGIGGESLAWGLALVLAGLPVYWWMKRRK